MPQIKSSIKRVKTSEKSHLRNISYKSKIKSSIKRFNLALSEKNKEDINKYFLDSVSILDKSVSKGILLKNTASRKKSALNKKLNAMLTSETDEKLTPDVPKKTEKAQEKPVAPKEKTKTTKTAKTKEKPIVKKAAKAVKKSAAKKTETKKAKK